MKKILITLCLMCMSLNFIFAQLTLQKVNSKKTVTIPNGSEIMLKLPTPSNKSNFEPFRLYTGALERISKDSVTLILSSDEMIFTDGNNTVRKVYQSYNYSADKKIMTTIPTQNLLSLNKKTKSGKQLNAFAGTIMFLAAFNQLFLSPFFSQETRKISDKISAGAFGVGLVIAVLPKTKTYYIKRPKDGNKTLWQIKSN